MAQPVWLRLGINPCTKRSLFQFPVKAHAQVVDPVPSGGPAGGGQSMFSLIDVSISLLSLKINRGKIFLKRPCMMGQQKKGQVTSPCFPLLPNPPFPFKNLVSLLAVVAQERRLCGGIKRGTKKCFGCDR
uniref:Uncharacterized protein n=1 Tax=Molossus molossus TaxID=27622 RepID=A0A7J8FYF0_MOLMO|nr:hypothetical protein HJG59_008170 [Molossus molossus]